MFVSELDTFVKKFHQLWNDGYTAHLDLDTQAGNAWVGLRVQLGQVPGPPHHWQVHPYPQEVHRNRESPSRQRRRARRAAAKTANTNESDAVEPAVVVEASSTEKKKEEVVIEKVTDDVVAENAAISKTAMKDFSDEICSDEIYLNNQESNARRICSLELYPEQSEDIHNFRNKVENYFQQRTDVIERVIECKTEHFGTRVKLCTFCTLSLFSLLLSANIMSFVNLCTVSFLFISFSISLGSLYGIFSFILSLCI